jgi:hypothetical protein
MYLRCILYSNVHTASLLRINFNIFHLFNLLLEFTRYFQSAVSLTTEGHLSLTKSGFSNGMSARDAEKTTFRRPVFRKLSFLQIFCIQLSKVETLNIVSLKIQLF